MASAPSVLIAFTVTNFRSFRDSATLNFMRATKDFQPEFNHADVAPAVAVFGPNASGKSNLLRALDTMFSMIEDSATSGQRSLPYSPFVLSDGDLNPTSFTAIVRLDGIRYDYSFSYDAETILTESLYSFPKNRPRLLFEREFVDGEDSWTFGDSMTGPSQLLARATRRHALILSTASLVNHDILTPLQERFSNLVKFVDSGNMQAMLQSTLEALTEDEVLTRNVARLLQHADLGIASLSIEDAPATGEAYVRWRSVYEVIYPEASAEDINERIRLSTLQPQLRHARGDKAPVAMPFAWESLGTRNFLALLGPVLHRLRTGGVLVVDELDTSLHPRLVTEVVRLFQRPDTNPRQAQLISTTHDVTVMMNTGEYSALSRDQIWFVEKDHEGASELRDLARYKLRADEVFSRSYLNGRYGAIPRVNNHITLDLWDGPEK